MKKLLSLVLALAIIMGCLSMVTIFAAEANTLVNGNAEDTNGGWRAHLGGTTTIVEEPGNTSNHVAMFNPGDNKYYSVGYDFTPAIVQDAANGYAGSGAGVYTLKFRYKADADKGGNFLLYVCSWNHMDSRAINSSIGVAGKDTYPLNVNPREITMTDEWQTFEGTVTITEDFLNLLSALDATGNHADVNKLTLRVCGANGAYASNALFNYYLDDISLEKHPDPIGVKITASKTIASSTYSRVAAGFASANVTWNENSTGDGTANTTKSGTITRKYTIYNTSDTTASVGFLFQGGNRGAEIYGWDTIIGGSGMSNSEIPANSKVEVTVSIPVYKFTDGAAVVAVSDSKYQNVTGYAPIDTVWVRLNVATLASGASVTVIGETANDPMVNVPNKDGDFICEKVYKLPQLVTPSPEVTATATATATATPKPTATVIPMKKVENGNVENGTTGWGNIHGGSVSFVQPGANGTGNAVKIDVTGQYNSISFELAPIIIPDKANGYDGAGAGRYTISFYAKAEAGKGGEFIPFLNSRFHKSASQVAELGLGLSSTVDTYLLSTPDIEMTDEWQRFEVDFEVTEEYINELKAIYTSSLDNAADAYSIALRLDGSGANAFDAGKNLFSYYIDEVVIEHMPEKSESVDTGDALPIALIAVTACSFTALTFVKKKKED